MYLPKQSIPVRRNAISSKYHRVFAVEAQGYYEIHDDDRFDCYCTDDGFPDQTKVANHCKCIDTRSYSPVLPPDIANKYQVQV